MEQEQEKKQKTPVFVILIAVCVAGLGALVFGVLYMLFNVAQPVYQWILIAIALVAVAFVILLLLGIFTMIFSAKTKKPLGKFGLFLLRRIFTLYPAAIALGKAFGISKSNVQDSYVNMNNRLVRSSKMALDGNEIAVLAPHCLQKNDCNLRVTQDIANCKECGNCDIAALKQLCNRLGVHLVVVTGGTLARNHVKAVRPKAIVAVACERDLSSGIMDVFPIPSLGVKNERPEGPCVNTRVEIGKVEEAILFFLKERGHSA